MSGRVGRWRVDAVVLALGLSAAAPGRASAGMPEEPVQVAERLPRDALLALLHAPTDTPVAPTLHWVDAPFPPGPDPLPAGAPDHRTEECQLAVLVTPRGRVVRAVMAACPRPFVRAGLSTLRRWRAEPDPSRPRRVLWVGRLTHVLAPPAPPGP